MRSRVVAALGAGAIAASTAGAQVTITVQNMQGAGGFTLSPFWLGLHDGSFDVFDAGSMASGGIVEIAELADTSALTARFSSEQAMGVQTTLVQPDGIPPFTPGESASIVLDPGDASVNRFFNYAAMVVPSNDMFVGNDGAIELFDAAGNFNGPLVINIYGRDVWDAGSEVNDITDGAAFIMGSDATLGTDENGFVTHILPGGASYLDSIVGLTTATGDTIDAAFGPDDLIARITITPAPGGVSAMLLACGLGVVRRRR
ncbi:MAG: spondin domain-containing protein [Phycisphaerales bacterium]